jgi:hypothetical protein
VSEKIPEKSSGGLYLIGAIALVGAAVALFFWKRPAPPPATPQVAVATPSAPTTEAPVLQYAPPPPPKLEEPDAGVDAGTVAVKTAGPSGPGPGPCGGPCSGQATGALRSALTGHAQSARGCYNRALRNNSEVSGNMMVSVTVGPGGQVCSASLANDTVGSAEVSNCVLGRFRGQSFPAPTGGCVTVNIPLSFTIKQ